MTPTEGNPIIEKLNPIYDSIPRQSPVTVDRQMKIKAAIIYRERWTTKHIEAQTWSFFGLDQNKKC